MNVEYSCRKSQDSIGKNDHVASSTVQLNCKTSNCGRNHACPLDNVKVSCGPPRRHTPNTENSRRIELLERRRNPTDDAIIGMQPGIEWINPKMGGDPSKVKR